MKKIKANLSIVGQDLQPTMKEVIGYYTEVVLNSGEVVRLVVHRDIVYQDSWAVSEFTTGMLVMCSGDLHDYTLAKTRASILRQATDRMNGRPRIQDYIDSFLNRYKLEPVNTLS